MLVEGDHNDVSHTHLLMRLTTRCTQGASFINSLKREDAKVSTWGPCVFSLDGENHAIEREGITPIKIMLELNTVSPGVVQCVRRTVANFR